MVNVANYIVVTLHLFPACIIWFYKRISLSKSLVGVLALEKKNYNKVTPSFFVIYFGVAAPFLTGNAGDQVFTFFAQKKPMLFL